MICVSKFIRPIAAVDDYPCLKACQPIYPQPSRATKRHDRALSLLSYSGQESSSWEYGAGGAIDVDSSEFLSVPEVAKILAGSTEFPMHPVFSVPGGTSNIYMDRIDTSDWSRPQAPPSLSQFLRTFWACELVLSSVNSIISWFSLQLTT